MNPVRIPADVDREDTLLAGLSARQLAILGSTAVVLWLAYEAVGTLMPAPVFAGLATPLAGMAVVLALVRRNGMTADRLLLVALRQAFSPRTLVAATEEVSRVPGWVGLRAPLHPSLLRVPAERISENGVLDLGGDGAALVCRASPLTFSLRTEREQEALIASFGRFLNGLGSDVQVVVRSELADLSGEAAELEARARSLPHPDLETAARDHAAFLRSIVSRREALRRAVFLVLRESDTGEPAATRLRRRADEAAAGLAAAGIALTVLDAEGVARALTGAWAHGGAGAVLSDEPVTRRCSC